MLKVRKTLNLRYDNKYYSYCKNSGLKIMNKPQKKLQVKFLENNQN